MIMMMMINKQSASLLFFVLPLGAVMVENLFFFVMTIYGILNSKFQDFQVSEDKSKRSGLVKFAESQEQRRCHDDGPDQRRWGRQKNKLYFIIYFKGSLKKKL